MTDFTKKFLLFEIGNSKKFASSGFSEVLTYVSFLPEPQMVMIFSWELANSLNSLAPIYEAIQLNEFYARLAIAWYYTDSYILH